MRTRLPYLLFAIGVIGVGIYPRLAQHLSPVMRTDFSLGIAIGACIGLELLGATMMIRARNRSRCRG